MMARADREDDIAWIKLTVVIYGQSIDEQEAHLLSHGFSEKGAERVREYIKRGDETLRDQEKQLLEAMCSRRTQIEEGGPGIFAQETEYVRTRMSEIRKTLVVNLQDTLSPTDAIHLDHLLRHHNVTVLDSEIPRKILEGIIPVRPTLDKLCNIGE